MAPLPLKMVACENRMDAASGFLWDRATGPTVSLAAKVIAGAEPGCYETKIYNMYACIYTLCI